MALNHLVIMVTEHQHEGLLALQAVLADQVITGCSYTSAGILKIPRQYIGQLPYVVLCCEMAVLDCF